MTPQSAAVTSHTPTPNPNPTGTPRVCREQIWGRSSPVGGLLLPSPGDGKPPWECGIHTPVTKHRDGMMSGGGACACSCSSTPQTRTKTPPGSCPRPHPTSSHLPPRPFSLFSARDSRGSGGSGSGDARKEQPLPPPTALVSGTRAAPAGGRGAWGGMGDRGCGPKSRVL